MGDIVARAQGCYAQAVEEYGPKACIFEVTASTAACIVEEMKDAYLDVAVRYDSPLAVFNAVLAALTP